MREIVSLTTDNGQWALFKLGCPAARPASVAAADETFIVCHTVFAELAQLA